MDNVKYLYEDEKAKFILEEDNVRWYLIVYRDRSCDKSTEDYLLDSLEEALKEAEERFGIKKDQWKLVEKESLDS